MAESATLLSSRGPRPIVAFPGLSRYERPLRTGKERRQDGSYKPTAPGKLRLLGLVVVAIAASGQARFQWAVEASGTVGRHFRTPVIVRVAPVDLRQKKALVN